jgi:hypothetical protein
LARCSVTEVQTPAQVILRPVDRRKAEVLDFVRANIGPWSRRQLAESIGGRASTTFEAINDLVEGRQLFEDPKSRRIDLPHDVLTALDQRGSAARALQDLQSANP